MNQLMRVLTSFYFINPYFSMEIIVIYRLPPDVSETEVKVIQGGRFGDREGASEA